jgi:hypothetical protein
LRPFFLSRRILVGASFWLGRIKCSAWDLAMLKPVQPEDLAARSDTVVRKQHSAADFMASSPNA